MILVFVFLLLAFVGAFGLVGLALSIGVIGVADTYWWNAIAWMIAVAFWGFALTVMIIGGNSIIQQVRGKR